MLTSVSYWNTNSEVQISAKVVNQPHQLGQTATDGGAQEERCPVKLDLTTASAISSTCFSPFFQYYLSHVPVDQAS